MINEKAYILFEHQLYNILETYLFFLKYKFLEVLSREIANIQY